MSVRHAGQRRRGLRVAAALDEELVEGRCADGGAWTRRAGVNALSIARPRQRGDIGSGDTVRDLADGDERECNRYDDADQPNTDQEQSAPHHPIVA